MRWHSVEQYCVVPHGQFSKVLGFAPQIVHVKRSCSAFARAFFSSYSRCFSTYSAFMIVRGGARAIVLPLLTQNRSKSYPRAKPTPRASHSCRSPNPLGVVFLAPGGRRVQKREAPDREGRRGEERRDDDAKAKHDSPARKRSISGSGDDAA